MPFRWLLPWWSWEYNVCMIINIGQLAEQPPPLAVSHTQRVAPQGWRTLTLMTVYYTEPWPVSSAKQITAWLNVDSIHRDVKYSPWKLAEEPRKSYSVFSLWENQILKIFIYIYRFAGQSGTPPHSYRSPPIISMASSSHHIQFSVSPPAKMEVCVRGSSWILLGDLGTAEIK